MKEVHFFYAPEAATATELPETEALHAVRVLRMKEGDELMLMDGQGAFYHARVTMATAKRCFYAIESEERQTKTWPGTIHLAIAPTKMMERMEWLAEKATEIGLDRLSFLNCRFSERVTLKLPRIEKIVVSAVKQSRKAWMPQLDEMTDFSAFVKAHPSGRRYIAHCYEEVPRVNLFDELRRPSDEADVLVMVGPEGDFSIDEVRMAVDAGFVSVDLGKSRLRTETAGLVAVMTAQLSASSYKECGE